MRRHTLLAALWVAFGLVWLPFAAEAQQAKLHRLGFLANHSPSNPEYLTFLQTLRELGYVEGKNITLSRPDMRKTILIACPNKRATWSASTRTCCSSPANKV
jgi:hypothetical protein